MTRTRNAMEKLREALEEVIERRTENFDNRSEQWQDSESGDIYQSMTDQLEEILDNLNDWIFEIVE